MAQYKLPAILSLFLLTSLSSYSQHHILFTSIMRDDDVIQKYLHQGVITRNGESIEIYIADVKVITTYTVISEKERTSDGTKFHVLNCYNHNSKKNTMIVNIPKTIRGNRAWQIFINDTDYITGYEFDCRLTHQN